MFTLQGISFDDFRKFCQFLNTLDDFTIAMKMYTYADQAVSKGILSFVVSCTMLLYLVLKFSTILVEIE